MNDIIFKGGFVLMALYLLLRELFPFLLKLRIPTNGNGNGSPLNERGILFEMNRTIGEINGTIKSMSENYRQMHERVTRIEEKLQ